MKTLKEPSSPDPAVDHALKLKLFRRILIYGSSHPERTGIDFVHQKSLLWGQPEHVRLSNSIQTQGIYLYFIPSYRDPQATQPNSITKNNSNQYGISTVF